MRLISHSQGNKSGRGLILQYRPCFAIEVSWQTIDSASLQISNINEANIQHQEFWIFHVSDPPSSWCLVLVLILRTKRESEMDGNTTYAGKVSSVRVGVIGFGFGFGFGLGLGLGLVGEVLWLVG